MALFRVVLFYWQYCSGSRRPESNTILAYCPIGQSYRGGDLGADPDHTFPTAVGSQKLGRTQVLPCCSGEAGGLLTAQCVVQVPPGAAVRRLSFVAALHDTDSQVGLICLEHDQLKAPAPGVRRLVEGMQLHACNSSSRQARSRRVDS